MEVLQSSTRAFLFGPGDFVQSCQPEGVHTGQLLCDGAGNIAQQFCLRPIV